MHALNDIPFFAAGWQVAVWRLVAAFVAGAILGLEREHRERPAGLRTHILVSVTTCLALLTVIAAPGDPGNPGRVAQGLVTGIGFIGAGTILRYGVTVRGLTTAATIWAAAGVGIALAFGWYLGAAVAVGLVLITLLALRGVDRLLHQDGGLLRVEASLSTGTSFSAGLIPLLEEAGVEIFRIDAAPGPPALLRMELEPTAQLSPAAVVALVQSAPGVAAAELVERATWKVERGEGER
jgi:putative Mg2+ transporter-C (MgtC) family protein